MIKKKVFFLVFLFLYTSLISSQELERDNFYLKKLYKYSETNNDSVLFYANKIEESKDSCLRYNGKIYKAQFYYRKENYIKAEKIANKISKDLKNKNNFCLNKIRIESLNRLFWIKKNQTLYDNAFKCLLEIKEEIDKISKNDDYYKTINTTLKVNLSLIKSLLGHHKEARNILKKYLTISKKNNSKSHKDYSRTLNQANILNLIGESFLKSTIDSNSSYLDSASLYFKRSFKIAKTFKPLHENSETLYQLREAEVLIAQKEFTKALTLIQKFENKSIEYKTEQNINSLKTICFFELNNNNYTIYYAKKYLVAQKKNSTSKKSITIIYDILANQYFKNKQIDSAYKYSELTIAELNILSKNKNEVNKLHYLYDYNNAQKLNTLILKKEKGNRNVFASIIFTLIVLGLLIVYLLFKKNKKIANDLIDIKFVLGEKRVPEKKEYNLDEKLEKKLLDGISKLKQSTDFLAPDFSISALSKKLNTNTSYLSYLINKEFNQSFKQYITELRIEYLIKKLTEKNKYRNYTIKSLAEEIGYTNASAFTRAFKKYKGITPSEFIKCLNQD